MFSEIINSSRFFSTHSDAIFEHVTHHERAYTFFLLFGKTVQQPAFLTESIPSAMDVWSTRMSNIDISVQTHMKSSNSAGCHLEIKAVYRSVSPAKFVGNVNLLASHDRHLRDVKARNSGLLRR